MTKLSRRLQLWMADRDPAFDRPSIYRRTPGMGQASLGGWDAVLLTMIAMILIGFGILGLAAGVFVLGLAVTSWL